MSMSQSTVVNLSLPLLTIEEPRIHPCLRRRFYHQLLCSRVKVVLQYVTLPLLLLKADLKSSLTIDHSFHYRPLVSARKGSIR